MKLIPILSAAVLASSPVVRAAGAGNLYENGFDQATVGAVPDDFLVLDGQFAVKEEGGNKFLEFPGAPLDTFGVLFGPTDKENVAVAARIHGTAKGRRFPAFAVSLSGVGGYRLQVSPAKKLVELLQGDALKASAPFEWTSSKWTELRLRVVKAKDGEWKIEGKVWQEGAAEPSAWTASFTTNEAPISGRAAVWGNPFAGTPIRFDDLKVSRAGP